jgi:hypothetical protein
MMEAWAPIALALAEESPEHLARSYGEVMWAEADESTRLEIINEVTADLKSYVGGRRPRASD